MKKVTLLLFAVTLALWAADVWQSKPFTDWSEKDLQKIMTDSPWAKKVSVTLPGLGGPPVPGAPTKGGGGRGGGGKGGPQGTADSGGGDPGVGGDSAPGGGGVPETQLIVRWRTALVVNEALAKSKFGAEAGTSPDAKKMLQPEEKVYVIWVSGLPANLRPKTDEEKQAILKQSTLSAKDKDSIAAVDVQFSGQGRASDFYYLFPRAKALTVEDKEVEFATKLGKTAIKTKFRLKDMEINGKLDL
jgi:hypothetical protein